MPNRPSRSDPSDIRDLNLASGIATAVGIYSLLFAVAVALQPARYWGSASFVGYVIAHVSPWPPALAQVVLAAALFYGSQREGRLVWALALATGVFAFWAVMPLAAARVGALPYPSVNGFLTFSWFASVSGYALFRTWRLSKRQPPEGALRGAG